MKRLEILTIVVICLLVLILAGCGAPTPTAPTPAPKPEPLPTPTPSESQPETAGEEAGLAVTGLQTGWVQSIIYEHLLIYPNHLTTDGRGTVLVDCRVKKTILQLTAENELVPYADLSSVPGKVEAMSFQPSHGRLLLVTDMGELYAYSDGKLTRLQSRESIHLWAMAVRSDGSFYGVRRARGAPIHYYDANGNRIGTVVASTDCVFQMTLDRTSSKLYYSESYTGDIVEKDLISGESRVLASGTGIPDTYEPIALAIDDGGHLWYHSVRQGLNKYQNGNFVKIMDTQSAAGELLWSSSHGAFLQVIEAQANIFSYNPTTLTANNLTQAVNAIGAVEMDDGTVLVINQAFPRKAIYKVDASGFTPFSTEVKGGFSDLARDVHGNVYCASLKDDSIYRVAADGSLTRWAGDFSSGHVCSLTFDAKNDALIALTGSFPGYFPNSSTATVWRVPLEDPSMPIRLADLTGVMIHLNQPCVTSDRSGNVFILEYNNNAIFKIPDGSTQVITFAGSVLDDATIQSPSFAYLSHEDALLVGTIFDFQLWPVGNPVKSVFARNNGAVDNWVISETRDGGFVAAHSSRIFRLTPTNN